MRESSYDFIKYLLMYLFATGTLHSILTKTFNKLSSSDVFTYAVAHRIAGHPKFLEPIIMRKLHRAGEVVEIDRQSNPRDHRRSLLPRPSLPRATLDSGNNSSDDESEDGRSRLKTETKKAEDAGVANARTQKTSRENVAKTNMSARNRRKTTIDTFAILL